MFDCSGPVRIIIFFSVGCGEKDGRFSLSVIGSCTHKLAVIELPTRGGGGPVGVAAGPARVLE